MKTISGLRHVRIDWRRSRWKYWAAVEGWQICTHKGSELKTDKDLIELSKTRPVVAASIGRGGASHLQLILLQEVTGMKMNIVHFAGSAQAYPQVIGGNVDIACTGPGSASRRNG